MADVTLSLADAQALAEAAFRASGATAACAAATARALVSAQADGQGGHGLMRILSYTEQLKAGKANPAATPRLEELSPTAVAIDAGFGLAYEALELAVAETARRAKGAGVAIAAIRRSHHFGQAGAHAERLAERGLIGLVFGNSPKAIAFWGAAKPAMGTNPIAFAAPMPAGAPPLVIDLAVSVAARGKVVAAEKAGTEIPADWALDAKGDPTTDPAEAMRGSMAPVGGAKGAALALMVEVLAAGVTASHFGFEASSLFDAEGAPPNLGQTLLAIDADLLSGGAFLGRMGALRDAIDAADGARLPGQSRIAARAKAAAEGVSLPQGLYDEIKAIAGEAA
ncbi:MAG: Ldh family oxidoreductase [Pseudomonadota bacterium]